MAMTLGPAPDRQAPAAPCSYAAAMSSALPFRRGSRYGWWSRSSIASLRSPASEVMTAVASRAPRAACATASPYGTESGRAARISLVRLSRWAMKTTGTHASGTRNLRS